MFVFFSTDRQIICRRDLAQFDRWQSLERDTKFGYTASNFDILRCLTKCLVDFGRGRRDDSSTFSRATENEHSIRQNTAAQAKIAHPAG